MYTECVHLSTLFTLMKPIKGREKIGISPRFTLSRYLKKSHVTFLSIKSVNRAVFLRYFPINMSNDKTKILTRCT